MCLNFHWFQNGQPSKLNNGKNWSFDVGFKAYTCIQKKLGPREVRKTIEKNVSFSTKMEVLFLIVRIWKLIILELVEVQTHNVPHFKGLIVLYLDVQAQGRDTTFSFHHAHLKKAVLYRKNRDRSDIFLSQCTLAITRKGPSGLC